MRHVSFLAFFFFQDSLREQLDDLKPLAIGIHENEGLGPTESWAKAAGVLAALLIFLS